MCILLGAGIWVSRSLMEKMYNKYSNCLTAFHSVVGGDAIVSLCAAYSHAPTTSLLHVLVTLRTLLTVESTLHQLDVRGNADGFFQSGFKITSLHHFFSWFTLLPSWHPIHAYDPRDAVGLIGKASEAVGGDNWSRRYIFGNGSAIVALGYSIVLYKEPVTEQQLGETVRPCPLHTFLQSRKTESDISFSRAQEHTWDGYDSYYTMREPILEGVQKTTYYISAVEEVSTHFWRLTHVNENGDEIVLMWDARSSMDWVWRGKKSSADRL